MYVRHFGADVKLPVLRLSFSKVAIAPRGIPCFVERSLPGKIKFGLIFIQIGFFLQQLENEVIIVFSGIFLKNTKFMFLEAIPRIKNICCCCLVLV